MFSADFISNSRGFTQDLTSGVLILIHSPFLASLSVLPFYVSLEKFKTSINSQNERPSALGEAAYQ